MASLATPADLAIVPRNLRFGRNERRERWWLGGDPFGTAYNNAMSITFPQGEAFFIETVRRFRDAVPAELGAQIDLFVKQEIHHTREHVAFNRQVADAGYEVKAMEEWVRERLTESRAQHPVAQLCVTVALEHFTAIFAHHMLTNPEMFDGASEEARRMWTWHAIEEVEHKAVAFDTYMHITRELKPAKRWAIRSLVFWRVSKNFVRGRSRDALELLRQDGITGWAAWKGLLNYLLVRPGALRKVFPMWLSYFRPGFHPWDHDDRHLIEKVEAELRLEAPVAEAA
ncbi:metal-dependent hydrolase [Sphingoaurantiacus capsulatus]|uniref:Metal-dependent hydrolase n=1 Tax=Sphingoaurantiacus capsulatus TaxID=1771310 RepID=A0ABV7X761_9SPHN